MIIVKYFQPCVIDLSAHFYVQPDGMSPTTIKITMMAALISNDPMDCLEKRVRDHYNLHNENLKFVEYTSADFSQEWTGGFSVAGTVIGCEHEWVTYTGFSESYEYCKECDKRRE